MTKKLADEFRKKLKDNKAEIAYLFDDDWDMGVEAVVKILEKLMESEE